MAQWLHTWNGKRTIHKTKKAATRHQRNVGGRVRKLKNTKANTRRISADIRHRKRDDMTKIIRPIIGASFGIAALRLVTR